MDLMRTIATYLPGLVIVGALLLVVGLLVRLLAATGPLKVTGNKIMSYGVVAISLAIALWAIMRVMEAWQTGKLDAWFP